MTRRGNLSWRVSKSYPSLVRDLTRVEVRKTSALASRRSMASRPVSLRRSMVMKRLLAFDMSKPRFSSSV